MTSTSNVGPAWLRRLPGCLQIVWPSPPTLSEEDEAKELDKARLRVRLEAGAARARRTVARMRREPASVAMLELSALGRELAAIALALQGEETAGAVDEELGGLLASLERLAGTQTADAPADRETADAAACLLVDCLERLGELWAEAAATRWRSCLDRYAAVQAARTRAGVWRLFAWTFGALLAVLLALQVGDIVHRHLELNRQSTFQADLVRSRVPKDFGVGGLSPEKDKETLFAWALGPQTLIDFTIPKEKKLRLSFVVSNSVPGQELVVEVNGVVIKEFKELPVASWLAPSLGATLEANARAGRNVVVLRYKAWNHHGADLAPNDGRPLALTYLDLRLETH